MTEPSDVGGEAIRAGEALDPPKHVIDFAVEVSCYSPCRSKRGVVIFEGEDIVANGYNFKPRGFDCDGTVECKATCRVEAVHAEQAALLAAGSKAWTRDMLHVKTVNGKLVASGSPSCVQCSKLALAAGIAGVWLYHADGWHRHNAQEFHRLSVERLRASSGSPEQEEWRTWGIIELAIRNVNVASYMNHWEGRALKAEAASASRSLETETPDFESMAKEMFDEDISAEGIEIMLRNIWNAALTSPAAPSDGTPERDTLTEQFKAKVAEARAAEARSLEIDDYMGSAYHDGRADAFGHAQAITELASRASAATERPLLDALDALIIDANRLCDRQLGGSYEADCRRSLEAAKMARRAYLSSPSPAPPADTETPPDKEQP